MTNKKGIPEEERGNETAGSFDTLPSGNDYGQVNNTKNVESDQEYTLKQHEQSDSVTNEINANSEGTALADCNRKYFTLEQLLAIQFNPLTYYIARIITTGLTLLWGPPKGGKSILIVHALLAVSCGGYALGKLETKKAACLLLSLEDGWRRLQTRFIAANAISNNNLHIFTDWARGVNGLKDLEKFLDDFPDIKVVCIDTLVLFLKTKDTNDYSETTNLMSMLKRIADDRDICIIAIHHSKKMGKETGGEITETALGSTGIVAGPDHLLFLKRTPAGPEDAILYYRSKDAEPAELALHFDHDIAGWEYVGEASEIAETGERQEIINLLKDKGPMKTGDIAKELNKTPQATSNLIQKMLKKEMLHRLHYGLYGLSSIEPHVSNVSSVSMDTKKETIPGSYTVTPVTPGNHERKSDTEPLDIF